MYLIKLSKEEVDKLLKGKTKKYFSNEVSKSRVMVTNVLNGTSVCNKELAYCITKNLDENAEINDYFTKIK